ncbi:MAG: DUF4426 domain-containing protein [Gammaproteobacteria bacterium]|nr:MAG: DUF4426 domain-containing protein [Gammaproteobacteria bacterium]
MRRIMLAWLLTLFSLPVVAEQSVEFGDYTIHYNAFPTTILPAEVARGYGITRSKSRGLLNVTVLKKVLGTSSRPVEATLRVTAVNLTGQVREIPMRKVEEENAIYYLGEFVVRNEETLRFTVEVLPEHQGPGTKVEFSQQFFTD